MDQAPRSTAREASCPAIGPVQESYGATPRGLLQKRKYEIGAPDLEALRRHMDPQPDFCVDPEALSELPQDLVRRIFRIDPADRRRYARLFASWIAPENIEDDELFYPILAKKFAQKDWGPLIKYEYFIMKRNKYYKSFMMKCAKEFKLDHILMKNSTLKNRNGEKIKLKLKDIEGKAIEEFESFDAKDKFVFLEVLGNYGEEFFKYKMENDKRRNAQTEDESEDWRLLAGRLRKALDGLKQPDLAAAEEILTLAEKLQAACAEHAAQAQQAQAAAVRAALAERLSALNPELAGSLETADAEALELWEGLIRSAEAAEAELRSASAEAEALKRSLDEANAAEDVEETLRLASLRAASISKRRLSAQVRTQALLALSAAAEAEAASAALAVEAEEILRAEPEDSAPQEPLALISVDAAEDPALESPAQEPEAEAEIREDQEPAQPPLQAAEEHDVSEEKGEEGGAPFAALSPEPSAALEAQLEEAEEPEIFEESAASPLLSPKLALARRLAQGDLVCAWHLARLSPEAGEPSPIPLAALTALILAPTVQSAEYAADQSDQTTALAEAALGLAPEEPDAPATEALVLAALLRPAFFSGDFNARSLIADLPRLGDAALCGGLIDALSALEYRFRLSTELLAGLAGQERAPRTPAAAEDLREWLAAARHRQYAHQPSYMLLHWALDSRGELGGALEAAIEGREGAEDEIEAIVERLSSTERKEAFVAECERRLKRPHKDRIREKALVWIVNHLGEMLRRLKAWLEARRIDSGETQSDDEAALRSGVGAVRKAAEAARAALSQAPEPADPLERAARIRLLAALEDLLTLALGKSLWSAPKSRSALFEAPLLRLPSGCQDWTGEDLDLAAERRARDERLLRALLEPDSLAPDDRSAFERHRAHSALLPAQALLARLRATETAFSVQAMEQALEERLAAAREASLERITRLRQELTDLAYLDVEAAQRQSASTAFLERLAEALSRKAEKGEVALPALNDLRDAQIPPDFPELDLALQALEADRDLLRARVRTAQAQALAEFRADPKLSASVARLEADFDRLSPISLDASLADLRSGRAVAPPPPESEDGFARFFPEFVEQAAAAPLSWSAATAATAAQEGRTAWPADFSRLDAAARRRAHRLLEDWAKAEKSFRAKDQRPLRESLKDLFQSLGAASVRIEPDKDLVQGRMRALQLICDPWRGEGWFVPPAYGAAGGGRHPILAVHGEVPPEQIVSNLLKIGRGRSCLAVVFGRLTAQQRRRLTILLRRERLHALTLDESLVLHVASEPTEPMAAFLAAAAPFSWLQPYDANPGRVAPEMFVGREEEMRAIVSLGHEGSLVYGGRRLGKSALLDRIRQDRHRPAEEQMAFLSEIGAIGGSGRPASEIWTAFAHNLRQEKAFARIGSNPEEILSAISGWLAERSDRRLLAMFDEADKFLRAEHAGDYPNLERLKQLMQDTGWRFKAVFAGLHNVRRMAQAPNSPLPHLGEAICVGPMNQTPQNRAALRRLATEPLRAAGFAYESPELVEELLARANAYPSLVQVFGQEVIKAMERRVETLEAGPRWLLGRDALFEGEAAEKIAAEIRTRFQLTLNLDPRYDLIAKCVAKRRLELSEEERRLLDKGLTVAEIEALAAPWWPAAIPRLTREDLAELLAEMVDLGVLTDHGADRYGLLNAQIARMLGDLEHLETELLGISSRPQAIDYDAAQFRRSLAPELPHERSPLSDRQLEALFDHDRPGLRIVTGRRATLGGRFGFRLAHAGRHWRSQPKIAGIESEKPDPAGRAISGAASRLRGFKSVLFIDHAWDRKSAHWLIGLPEVVEGRLLPVWILQDDGDQAVEDSTPALRLEAGLWSELMLRHWLAEEGLPMYDDPETRRVLVEATGLAPQRVADIREILFRHAAEAPERRQAAVAAWAAAAPLTLEALGLDEAFRPALDLLRLAGRTDSIAIAELEAEREGAATLFARLELAVPIGTERLSSTPLGRLAAGGGS